MIRVLNLTRQKVVDRAVSQMLALPIPPVKFRPSDWTHPAPISYRLDDSGLLGGDDPSDEMCADWSYGYRVPTADCIGFALWAAGIARRQPGYNGTRGEWLNTDSVLDDADDPRKFFRLLKSWEMVLEGDLLVSPSSKGLLTSSVGHIGVIVRPALDAGFKHLVIDCSPYHGRTTAINTREPWSARCKVVRPLFYKESQ